MLKCLLNLKIFSSRNFKFENLAEQNFVRQHIRHVKGLVFSIYIKIKKLLKQCQKSYLYGYILGDYQWW